MEKVPTAWNRFYIYIILKDGKNFLHVNRRDELRFDFCLVIKSRSNGNFNTA